LSARQAAARRGDGGERVLFAQPEAGRVGADQPGEGFMRKWLCTAAAIASLHLATPALAAGFYGPLIGLWQFDSYTVEDAAKQVTKPMGDHPVGYAVYTNSGHIMVVIIGNNRPAPAGAAPSDAEAAAYLRSMAAIAGTYKVVGKNKIMVHIEGAADPSLTGKDLPREFKVAGRKLTVTFAAKNPANGQDVQVTVNAHRVE
jgi:hypothetical protein